jgi:hypothetical protein
VQTGSTCHGAPVENADFSPVHNGAKPVLKIKDNHMAFIIHINAQMPICDDGTIPERQT